MMHFHDENGDFQGKTKKQIEDSAKWAFYCFVAISVILLLLFVTHLLQN